MPDRSPDPEGSTTDEAVRAYSPGRVNLIGDHTDYNGGVALPMAVDLGTTVTFRQDGSFRVLMSSADEPEPADVDIHRRLDEEEIRALSPSWARYVAAIVTAVRPLAGGRGRIESTLPVGAGLSSSASLEVALALALGFHAEPTTMALTCQRAEHTATGVPTGPMDQLVVTAAEEGCALLIDFSDLSRRPVPVPQDAEVVVVHSGQRRSLDRSPYAARRAECEAASRGLGPLGQLRPEDLVGIADAQLRSRARHVVTECDRVRWFCSVLESGDLVEAGRLMTASHRSLSVDFDVSTPTLDQLVAHLLSLHGVYGARMTGAGFGGCVVAISDPGAIDLAELSTPAWRVRPSAGARIVS